MNTRFKHLIKKFDCAFNQVIARKLTPAYGSSQWNLKTSSQKKFAIKFIDFNTLTNPLSMILLGRSIDPRIFGARKNYSEYDRYMVDRTPYSQLEKIFNLNSRCLSKAFLEGFDNRPTYINVYEDIYNRYHPDEAVAFDLGRFFMDKYFNIKLPYNPRFFNAI